MTAQMGSIVSFFVVSELTCMLDSAAVKLARIG